jgi:hypothetical protein
MDIAKGSAVGNILKRIYDLLGAFESPELQNQTNDSRYQAGRMIMYRTIFSGLSTLELSRHKFPQE